MRATWHVCIRYYVYTAFIMQSRITGGVGLTYLYRGKRKRLRLNPVRSAEQIFGPFSQFIDAR